MWINSVSHHSQLSSVSDRSPTETKRSSVILLSLQKAIFTVQEASVCLITWNLTNVWIWTCHIRLPSLSNTSRVLQTLVLFPSAESAVQAEKCEVSWFCAGFERFCHSRRNTATTTSLRLCDRVKKCAAARKTASTEPLSRLQDPVVTPLQLFISVRQSGGPNSCSVLNKTEEQLEVLFTVQTNTLTSVLSTRFWWTVSHRCVSFLWLLPELQEARCDNFTFWDFQKKFLTLVCLNQKVRKEKM